MYILFVSIILVLTTSFSQLDFVVKRITSLAAWQQDFKQHVDAIEGEKLEPLISGYGICWNIKYESRRHANNAREVSHSLKQQNEAIVDIIESGYRCNAP